MDKITVYLEDIADAMDASSDSWEQYLNTKTGEIVPVFTERSCAFIAEHSALAEEQLAEEVFLSHHYIRLPGHLDISELEIMRGFVRACEDTGLGQQLNESLSRIMPCANFRRHLTGLGRIDDYHHWRFKELFRKAFVWCEKHGIPFRTRTEGLKL